MHGPDRSPPDVQLVWRAELTRAALVHARQTGQSESIQAQINACPPASIEALTVPLASARAWLRQRSLPGPADVEGARVEQTKGNRAATAKKQDTGEDIRPCVRWTGDNSPILDVDDIRPGDTLVVPAEYGGLADFNWHPDAREPVADLGDRAQLEQRARPTLRLHPELPHACAGGDVPRPDDDESAVETRQRLADHIRTLLDQPGDSMPDWLASSLAPLAAAIRGRRARILRLAVAADGQSMDYLAIVGPRILRPEANDEASTEALGDDDASSFTHGAIGLRGHLGRVEDAARQFAECVGLPPALVDDVALAGRLHDVGKADTRFQRMLCGGSQVRLAMQREPLAKSAIPAPDRAARRRAAERSGYPRGTRHELTSVAMIQDQPELREKAHDWQLVLHLVASHHGWCRPFAPAVHEPDDLPVALELDDIRLQARTDHGLAAMGSGIAERFARLNRRYGWFTLAWLEAILRLADHRVSAREQVST